MGRRRTAPAVKRDPDWGRTVWWYIARTDEIPYSYWNGVRWGSSFRDYAAKYRTKEKAEKFAFELVAKDPTLIGIVKVLKK